MDLVVLSKTMLRLSTGAAIAIGAVVFSHWLLDLIVHRPDLELYPDGPKLGLGLWNMPVPEQALEIGLLAVAGEADLVAFLVEIVVQEGGQGVLVLDHQNIRSQSLGFL